MAERCDQFEKVNGGAANGGLARSSLHHMGIRTRGFAVTLTGLVLASAAWGTERVDATCYLRNAWQPRTWGSERLWTAYLYSQGGGIATFTGDRSLSDCGDAENYFNQNVQGLELKGLDLSLFYVLRFYGNDIAFTDKSPWVSTARTAAPSVGLDMALKGTGDNALTKKGVGRLTLNAAPQNFTSLDLVRGSLVITNDGGVDTLGAQGVPVTVKTGSLVFEPQTSGGTTKIATLQNGAGLGSVVVKKGGTLTVDNLETRRGGILSVQTTDGGKFLVAGKDSVAAPDGGLVSVSGTSVSFLDYDATAGWQAGSGTPANAKVYAADVAETADDLVFPGAGYVWRLPGTGASTFKVTGTISAPDGVTFASPAETTTARPSIDLSGQAQVDGKMSFVGTTLAATGLTPAKIAPTADLAAYGDGATANLAGTLNFWANIHHDDEFDMTLRLSGTDGVSALKCDGGDWQYKIFKQKGTTILEGDATIGSDTGNLIWFNGPVTGPGGLRVASGYARFYNANTDFRGDLQIESAAALTVWKGGRLGTGDIKLVENGRLYFNDLSAPLAVENHFIGEQGNIGVQKSQVSLAHGAKTKAVMVQNNSKLTVNGPLSGGSLYLAPDSTLSAGTQDAEISVTGEAGPCFLQGKLTDGASGGKLSLVKSGSGTLSVTGLENDYTGATDVHAGTLRLGGGIFDAADIVFWGDATDASTMTVQDGKVTEWRSKVGTYVFGASDVSSSVAPAFVANDDANYFNGKSFLRFTPGKNAAGTDVAAPYPSLKGSKEADIRTLFLVVRTKTGAGNTHVNGALVGYNTQDVSLRLDTTGALPLGSYDRQDVFVTAGYGYLNGVKKAEGVLTSSGTGASIISMAIPRHVISGGGYNHYSTFRPYLGANSNRPWGGDMAEVLMFSRELTDAERCTVENYLMAKWNPTETTPHPAEACQLPARRNFLPTATDLTVSLGATLDLNGSEQTVKTLSGEGLIVNTSETPATLTVAEGGDFHGRVEGNVTLVLPSGSRGILLREGAKLVVSGSGETALSVDNPQPPTHDLAFWLDASKPETVLRDASGNVTNWLCREAASCTAPRFRRSAGNYPTYEAAGWNAGKPAVFLNDKNLVYMASDDRNGNVSTDVMTLFYVVKPVTGTGCTYSFGPHGLDVGMTISPEADGYTVSCRGPSLLNIQGDLLRLNGVDKTADTAGSYSYHQTPALVYVMRACASHQNASYSNLRARNWCLGSHSGSRAVAQYVAEVIAYTKPLTDAEIRTTEQYLMDKWVNSGTSWPTPETVAIDASSSLGVTSGATVDLGAADTTLKTLSGEGGTLATTGLLTVTDEFRFPVVEGRVQRMTIDGNLAIGASAKAVIVNGDTLSDATPNQPALQVTGTVTGGRLSEAEGLSGNWRWTRSGNLWSVVKSGLLVIFR